MSDSPLPIPLQLNGTETMYQSPNFRAPIPIDDTSISEKNELPIIFKSDDRSSTLSSHIDENNENEAVAALVSSFDGDQSDRRTTNTESLMHLIKGNVGAGVLAFPYALSKAGLLFGSICFWFMGAMTIYCMQQLLRCHQLYQNRTLRSKCDYGDIMRYTLEECRWPFARRHAKIGKFLIDGFIVITQLGFCCVYFVFVPASVKQVVDYYTPHSPSIRIYQLIMLVFIVAFSFVRNLKILAPVSLVANIFCIGGLCIIMQYVVRSHKPLSDLPLVTNPVDWPSYFSSAMYAFEGISLVLPVRQKMKDPQAYGGFNGVLNTGMYLVTILYFIVGFFGYIRYGNDARGSLTLNLPVDEKLYQFTKLVYATAIFLTYNLQFYVPFTLLWPRICRRILYRYTDRTKGILEYVFRFGLILITFGFAVVIPNIGLVIALVGAIASSALAVIFPPICETISFWPNDLGRLKWRLIINFFIVLFGFYVFFAGTYLSLANIVACISKGNGCEN